MSQSGLLTVGRGESTYSLPLPIMVPMTRKKTSFPFHPAGLSLLTCTKPPRNGCAVELKHIALFPLLPSKLLHGLMSFPHNLLQSNSISQHLTSKDLSWTNPPFLLTQSLPLKCADLHISLSKKNTPPVLLFTPLFYFFAWPLIC